MSEIAAWLGVAAPFLVSVSVGALIMGLMMWGLHQLRYKGRRMGVNLDEVRCPSCQAEMPRLRRPANRRQALWGGWRCSECGCEMDRMGEPVDASGRHFGAGVQRPRL